MENTWTDPKDSNLTAGSNYAVGRWSFEASALIRAQEDVSLNESKQLTMHKHKQERYVGSSTLQSCLKLVVVKALKKVQSLSLECSNVSSNPSIARRPLLDPQLLGCVYSVPN